MSNNKSDTVSILSDVAHDIQDIKNVAPPRRFILFWVLIQVFTILYSVCAIVVATEAVASIGFEFIWILTQAVILGILGVYILMYQRNELYLGVLSGSALAMSLQMLTMGLIASSHIVSKGEKAITAAEAGTTTFSLLCMVCYFNFGILTSWKRDWILNEAQSIPDPAVALETTLSPGKMNFILSGISKLLNEAGMTAEEISDIIDKVSTSDPPRWTHMDIESMMQGPEELARALNIVTNGSFNLEDEAGQDIMDILEDSSLFQEYLRKYEQSDTV